METHIHSKTCIQRTKLRLIHVTTQINLQLSWVKETRHKDCSLYVSIYITIKKRQNHSARKQIIGCKQQRWERRLTAKGNEGTFWGNVNVPYLILVVVTLVNSHWWILLSVNYSANKADYKEEIHKCNNLISDP